MEFERGHSRLQAPAVQVSRLVLGRRMQVSFCMTMPGMTCGVEVRQGLIGGSRVFDEGLRCGQTSRREDLS